VAKGLPNAQIVEQSVISPCTINQHLTHQQQNGCLLALRSAIEQRLI